MRGGTPRPPGPHRAGPHGLYSCLDYYQDVGDPFSKELLDRYNTLYPGDALFTGGGACSGMYRA